LCYCVLLQIVKISRLFVRINNKLKKGNKVMATSQELYEQISDLFLQFEAEHNSTTKAGKGRARKAIGELKKLVTDYRKASVAENK
jgi:intein/homing endonuclease